MQMVYPSDAFSEIIPENVIVVAVFVILMTIAFKVTPHITWTIYNWIHRAPTSD